MEHHKIFRLVPLDHINHVADAGDVLWNFPSCLLLKRPSYLTGMAVQAESVAFLECVKLASLP
jgi:hypothetical protein